MDRPADDILAHHEAAHAVVALNLGLHVALTTILGPPERPSHTDLVADVVVEDPTSKRDADWYYERHVMMCVAAREAVAIEFGDDRCDEGAVGDDARAEAFAFLISYLSAENVHLYLDDLRRDVRQLVIENSRWQIEIKTVAAVLSSERTLRGLALEALIGQTKQVEAPGTGSFSRRDPESVLLSGAGPVKAANGDQLSDLRFRFTAMNHSPRGR